MNSPAEMQNPLKRVGGKFQPVLTGFASQAGISMPAGWPVRLPLPHLLQRRLRSTQGFFNLLPGMRGGDVPDAAFDQAGEFIHLLRCKTR